MMPPPDRTAAPRRLLPDRSTARSRGLALVVVLVVGLAALDGCGRRDAEPGPAPSVSEPTKAPAGSAPAKDAPAETLPLRLDGSVSPREVAVELWLDPARDDARGVVTIAAEVTRSTRAIRLHGKSLAVSAATVAAGQRPIPATATARGEFLDLALPEAVGPGPVAIRIEYTAKVSSTDTQGLFRQTHDEVPYLYTQFEPTAARQAFPCFDEPGFKVPWQLTLHVPRGMTALSNTPIERQTTEGALDTVVFRKTRPLPSYLVAVAVGPFELVDAGVAGRNRVPLRVAAFKGRAADAAHAARTTGALVDALERYFDVPFPYEKLDSVAVPNFPGAMENAGMMTYAASLLLARPNENDILHQQSYASIAGHEIAHQWFGDLVTMAWWDDIWLNESFATFMAELAVGKLHPEWNRDLARLRSAQSAFAADGLVSARKVRNPIQAHGDIMGAFDAISYQKGGALLGMFESWMGPPRFQEAIHAYLTDHAWGSATSADFIAKLAAASRPEVAAAFETFLAQGGVPLVSLDLACEAGKPPELVLAQERFLPIGSAGSADQVWSIPMCVGVPRGAKRATQCFLFDQKIQRVALEGPTCPAWVDGNPGGQGYYRVRYAGDLAVALLRKGRLDTVGRTAEMFNLRALVGAGLAPMSAQLEVIPTAARDQDPDIVAAAASMAEDIELLVASAQYPSYARYLARSFAAPARRLGWTPREGESSATAKLRLQLMAGAALVGQDPALVAAARAHVRRFLDRPDAADLNTGGVALATVMRARPEPALFRRVEEMFEASTNAKLRAALLTGMVMSREPAQRDATLRRVLGGKLGLQELATVLFASLSDPLARDAAWVFLVEHLHEVAMALPSMARPALAQTTMFFCDAAHRKTFDTAFRAELAGIPGGDKALAQGLEQMDLCIARREAQGAAVAEFLARQ